MNILKTKLLKTRDLDRLLTYTLMAIYCLIVLWSAVNGRYTRHDAARFFYNILNFHGIIAGDPSRFLSHFLFEFPTSYLSQFYLNIKFLSLVYGLSLGLVPVLFLAIAIHIEKKPFLKLLYLNAWIFTQIFTMTMPVSETNLAFPYFLFLLSYFRSLNFENYSTGNYKTFALALVASGFIHQTFIFFHFFLLIILLTQFIKKRMVKFYFLQLSGLILVLMFLDVLTSYFYSFGSLDSYLSDGRWFFVGSHFIISVIILLLLAPLIFLKFKKLFFGFMIIDLIFILFYLSRNYELNESVYLGGSSRVLNLIVPSIIFIIVLIDNFSEILASETVFNNLKRYAIFLIFSFLAMNRMEMKKWDYFQKSLLNLVEKNSQSSNKINFISIEDLERTGLQFPQYNFLINQALMTGRVTALVPPPRRVESYIQTQCSEFLFLRKYGVDVLDCPL